MKKLKLDLNELKVESFEIQSASALKQGTVHGNASQPTTPCECPSIIPTACTPITCNNPSCSPSCNGTCYTCDPIECPTDYYVTCYGSGPTCKATCPIEP